MLIENLETPVGEIVRENFRAASIFQKHGIDFCCGGKQSISHACEKHNVEPAEIMRDLASLSEGHGEVQNYNAWELDFLIDFIVNNHHSYVRNMLPVISQHAEKVASVHGANHPENIRIAALFNQVHQDLEPHMFKEEQILFPYIKQMVAVQREGTEFGGSRFGTVRNPIGMMEMEHETVGKILAEIRMLGNDLTPPEDACTTYRVLYKELDEFERDLHRHIHLENNILHPKAIAMETQLIG